MAYACIDYGQPKWPRRVKYYYDVNELCIEVPPFSDRASKKYSDKVLTLLEKNEVKNVVIGDTLLKNRTFCENLMEHHKSIVTGRRMYRALVLRILKDLAFQMQVDLCQLRVVLLMDDYLFENMDLTRTVAKEVKSLTIVTTDKDKFDMLTQNLYEENGIVLKVVEKGKITFKNAHVLLNVDFPCYDMVKISVGNPALIVCGFAQYYPLKSNFNGIIIKKIDVICPDNHRAHIDDLSLCEARIYHYLRKVKENDRIFEREGFQLNGYWGENGKITCEEFRKLGKILLDK